MFLTRFECPFPFCFAKNISLSLAKKMLTNEPIGPARMEHGQGCSGDAPKLTS